MGKKKLKVFHGLVNYGTQAGLLAKGLRELGVEAKAYTKADLFYRQTDYHFKQKKTLLAKVFFYKIWYPMVMMACFFRYNTFHFYFGRTLLKNQRDLPFYNFFGKKVIMEYLGNDIRHYESLVKRYKLPEDHDFVSNMNEHDNEVRKRVKKDNKYFNYLISCLPAHVDFAKEYEVDVKEVLPLALDLNKIDYIPLNHKSPDDSLIILHSPTNRVFKGTRYIEEAVSKLGKEGYKIKLRLIEGVTHKELIKEYQNCDIFIDQISVGWFGTAALEAMAIGRPTCAFVDERYFKYINYSEEIPVINVTKEKIKEQLEALINKRDELPKIGEKSRDFVEKYHDVANVSKKLLNIYQEKVWAEAF